MLINRQIKSASRTSYGGKHDGNMTIMFVSCISLRNVIVSSWLYTDLMFSPAIVFSVLIVTYFMYIIPFINIPTFPL